VYIIPPPSGIAEQVQLCFEKLSSRPAGSERSAPSSFRFCWGGGASDGPSLHHQRLDGVLSLRDHAPSNASYWHPAVRASQYDPKTLLFLS